jgi:hypothetical protein
MAVAAHETREEKFQWLINPFAWALRACLMAALFGFSLATDPTFIPSSYVLAGLLVSNLAIAGLLVWGIVRMRATYEGRL